MVGEQTPLGGRLITEKGLKTSVITELVEPFKNRNHVVYLDNYYTSGPLIDNLAKDKIYVVGTIQQRAQGFPASLKGLKLAKGEYCWVILGTLLLGTIKLCPLQLMSSLRPCLTL